MLEGRAQPSVGGMCCKLRVAIVYFLLALAVSSFVEKLELRVNGIVIAVTQISTPIHLVAQFHIFSTLITSTTDYVNLQVPQPPMFSTSHYLNLTLPQPDVHSTSNSLNLTAVSNFTFNISLPQPHAHSFTLPTSYSVLSSTSPRIGLLAGRRPALAEGWLSVPSLLRFFTGLHCIKKILGVSGL